MISKRAATWGKSHVGSVRKHNQDRYLVKELPEIIILAVTDGIAGCPGGELAAQIVIDETQKYKFPPKKIKMICVRFSLKRKNVYIIPSIKILI